MKRATRRRHSAGRSNSLTSMVDVTLLVLGVTLLKALFGVESVPLPNIVGTESAAAAGNVKAPSQIALRVDGDVTYQGEPIALDEVPARIKAEPDQTRPVLLSIEKDDEARISASLPQLLHDLSQSGVGHRVQVQRANLKASEP